jgi:hypothetical protein
MPPHTHPQETNIPQHTQCGEKWRHYMETGAESNADTKMQLGSQPFMWQFKNILIPERQKQPRQAPTEKEKQQ